MSNADLFLDDDFTTIVRKLELTVNRDATPNIFLNPGLASLTIGGGTGSSSRGSVTLNDVDGEKQVVLDADDSSAEFADGDGKTRVDIDGETARIDLHPDDDFGSPMSIDGSSGSIEFVRDRYTSNTSADSDDQYTSPMLNMFTGTDPDLSFFGESGPTVPIIAYSARMPTRGLMYDDAQDQFVFQEGPSESTPISDGSGDIDFEGSVLDTAETYPVLTVDLDDDRVGIGTDEPTHPLHVEGQVKADNVTVTSDSRCKTAVEPLNGALETVTELEGMSYEWTDEFASEDEGRHLGFIAQEVESVLPEVVDGDGDELRSLAQSELTALLVEAIKEQQTELDAKDERIADQADRIDALEDRLDHQEARLEAMESRLDAGESADV